MGLGGGLALRALPSDYLRTISSAPGPFSARTGESLNRIQAEAKLRRRMARQRPPAAGSSVSFASAAELMLRTTLDNYRSILRAHLLPKFGEVAVSQVRRAKSKRS